MEIIGEAINAVVNDPALFKEARYEVVPSLPLNLGSISLGYSNGEPKVYVTKMVGSEGCIDWNISKLLSTCKQACVNREFTPELSSMFQGVTNELMPGFACDMATFHWFLRPHAQDTKVEHVSIMYVLNFRRCLTNSELLFISCFCISLSFIMQ